MKKQLFKEVIVWFEKSEKELIRYRLFQKLSDGKFFVKSADNLQEEIDAKINEHQQGYFVDSLFDNGITEFAKECFDTIEQAISAFDAGSE
jgi:hypothetical protein